MKTVLKADAKDFLSKLKNLRKETWLNPEQREWTKYLFHFADITNVVSILTNDEIVSRANMGKDFRGSASSSIIKRTDDRWKTYVRFYMRPKTPTLANVEGFRTKNLLKEQKYEGAHCPVPIFLLFDFEYVISLSQSLFSRESLARNNVDVFSSADEFSNLPFRQIYHDSSTLMLSEDEKRTIIGHRQAEVIVPDSLGLESLKYIYCRSKAEYDTLRYLLPDEIWNKWRDKIIPYPKRKLFIQNWLYVRDAQLNSEKIVLQLNQPKEENDRGPFKLEIKIIESLTDQSYSATSENFECIFEEYNVPLSNLSHPEDYIVTLWIDGKLAYKNRHQEYDNIPY